jgi:GTPase
MTTPYIVSIVGRPNVGKSSLFNRILGKRIAVVDPKPGVTRDRQYREARWNGCDFTLVDTGGLDFIVREVMTDEIAKQVDIACEESDITLFLVDATVGVTDEDLIIARRLKKKKYHNILLIINKVESKQATIEIGRFYSLGLGEGFPISALHGKGVGDLLDRICVLLQKIEKPVGKFVPNRETIKIAIVGRPNAGKSSLVNKLLNEDRMIVTPIPGTTRDSIDTEIDYNGTGVVLIDTAGLRKKANVDDDVEYYCNVRTLESIKRCDICVLVIDSTVGLEEQDLKIIRQILLTHKGILLCWNKWDIRSKDHTTFDKFAAYTKKTYRELRFVPMVSVSAMTGLRVTKVIDDVLVIRKRMEALVPINDFHEKLKEWIRLHPHPMTNNEAVKIVKSDQLPARYPVFRFFSPNAKNAVLSYKRYLMNKIYENFDFDGCPISIEFKMIEKKHPSRGQSA